ncbi:MAG: DUF4317 domain-containing protein [Oscillospiraceae bacterium]|nr:DUF4317 domain-containing protein [Oscillospiraceae bacterium]
MNQKEVGELRRRLRPGKNNFSHVYGCYVSPLKEIIAEVDQPLSLLNEDDVESCLALLRKALSGGLGRNLVDVAFSTRQVAESEELKRLLALRDAKLKDAAARREFYETVIQNLELGEDSYLILLAQESYDVPFRTRNDEVLDDSSDTVYSYLLCAVCPMREGKPGLGYVPNENALHVKTAGRLASPPEVGFLWPAFDDRAPNLYNALYYVRKPELLHGEFISGVFGTEPPLSAPEQREAFETALTDALGAECSMELVQAVHEQLRERIELHKESKDPEPLTVTARDVGGMLRECGVEEERVSAFQDYCGQRLGQEAAVDPANLIDSRRFQIKAGEITITVKPELSGQVESRVLEGRTYLLIPAGDGVEVNGLPVELEAEPAAQA